MVLDDNGIDGLDKECEVNTEGATRYRILVKIAAKRCKSFTKLVVGTPSEKKLLNSIYILEFNYQISIILHLKS